MKRILILLNFIFIFKLFAADFNPQSDNYVLGRGANGIDKSLTVNVGDGASNPKLVIDETLKTFDFNKSVSLTGTLDVNGNEIELGDAVTGNDKCLIMDPTADSKLCWDGSAQLLKFNNGNAASDVNLGAFVPSVSTKTTTATLTLADDIVLADSTSGAFTITLPTAIGNQGKTYDIKKIDNNLTQIIIDANGAELIEGFSDTRLSTLGESIRIVSDNVGWKLLARVIPSISTVYSPTFSVTNATITARWQRRGKRLFVDSIIQFSGASTTNNNLGVEIPSGLVIDTASMTAGGATVEGGGQFNDNGSGLFGLFADLESATSIRPRASIVVAGQPYLVLLNPNTNSPVTYASGDYVALHFEVPIVGWESN